MVEVVESGTSRSSVLTKLLEEIERARPVPAPTAASATETYRYGPHHSLGSCTTDRDIADDERPSTWTFGGCYQMGPGAAAWYFNGYYSG
jgi:hypothetical protein